MILIIELWHATHAPRDMIVRRLPRSVNVPDTANYCNTVPILLLHIIVVYIYIINSIRFSARNLYHRAVTNRLTILTVFSKLIIKWN